MFDACVSLAEKTARLRQAVEEAKGEIAAYRAMREETYSKMLREVRARDAEDLAPLGASANSND